MVFLGTVLSIVRTAVKEQSGMGSSGLSGYSLSTHNTGLPLMAASVLSICLIISICARVCVHGWTGRGFYSLAALMLLEIRMLTQSLIWLHRSHPSQWNHINTNNVRYKLRSSLYPSLSFYICFSVSVDLNLNNQLFSPGLSTRRACNLMKGMGEGRFQKQRGTRGCWNEMKWNGLNQSSSAALTPVAFSVWAHTSSHHSVSVLR